MVVAVQEGKLVLEGASTEKCELKGYLQTYLELHNNMLETKEWMWPRLNGTQQKEWNDTLRSLNIVCRALDAGFDPCIPPQDWGSGLLTQYIAPVPAEVRSKIDLAIPIFGERNILIYDPNPDHFIKPVKVDPMAVGVVHLAGQRHDFCIGLWDIKADMKFLKPSSRVADSAHAVTQVIQNAVQVAPSSYLEMLKKSRQQHTPWVKPEVNLPGNYITLQSKWQQNMISGVQSINQVHYGEPIKAHLSPAAHSWVAKMTS